MNNTLGEGAVLANYYTRDVSYESLWYELAHQVSDGEIDRGEAVDQLFERWRQTWDTGDEEVFWAVHAQVADQFEDIVLRIQEGLELAPLATVRPDIEAGVMIGLGIHPGMLLTTEQINNIISGHRADGQKIEDKHYAEERRLPVDPKTGERKWSTPIGAYDFCPTPDKSVSVAWAFSTGVEQAKIFNAHIEAAREAVAYIGDTIGRARVGKGGEDGFEAGAIGWLEFTHHTSRRVQIITSKDDGLTDVQDAGLAGDPNLHTHFLIPNAVWTPSGRVGSLDTMAIRGFIFEADGLYQARLATKLREAGFEVALDERTGAARMTIVPEDVRSLFSKRTARGEADAKRDVADAGLNWDALSHHEQTTRIKEATQRWEAKQKKDGVDGGKDPVADFENWRKQAKEIGWEAPHSLELVGPALPPLTPEQRHQQAYEVGLPWLAEKLEHRSVVPHFDLRLAALRGLVHTGTEGLGDIRGVTTIMREQGVQQYGEKTPLIWAQEDGKRYTSVTTGLHESDEQEFVKLAKAAAFDKSAAIQHGLLKYKLDTSGLDFTDAHGRAQRSAIERVGAGGKLGVIVGAAGSGKTESLKPIVAAWQEMGRTVYGASLAWRQADELVKSGLSPLNVKAFSVLLEGIKHGEIKLDENAALVVDELGLLGTRQALELLRYRERYGFTVLALGDDKQTQSIEAGAIIDLTRRALGPEQVPEIHTTKRQKDREAEIVGLFREGRAATALDMKRSDGTAEMAYGGREGVLKRVAEIYVERLQATGNAPAISAPTNSDAHQIGEAVRTERRRLSRGGVSEFALPGSDGERNYSLRLSRGDHVRLFESTRADVGGKMRSIGRNGSIMEVLEVDRAGVRLRNITNDKAGYVRWAAMPQINGRVKLAYGYASTIHTSQGSTATEHIFALPSGSQAVTGAEGYTASTRHRSVAYLVTSEAAERIAVKESRPLNDVHEITLDDKWANVAKNFVTKSKMDGALALLDRVTEVRRGAVKAFHDTVQPNDPRKPGPPQHVQEMVQRRKLDVGLEFLRRSFEITRALPQSLGLSWSR